jgi:hypothetical protein
MTVYAIPDMYQEGFRALASLSEAAFTRLAKAAAATPPAVSPTMIVERLTAATGLDETELGEILPAVFSAAALRSQLAITPEELSESLATDALNLSARKVNGLRQRLVTLLKTDSIAITMRALDLIATGEKLFLAARILTDVRPVFPDEDGSGATLDPVGAIVLNTLRLEYLEAGQTRTINVSLDAEDISKLRVALDRADKKIRGLGGVITAAGVPRVSQPGETE